VHQVALAQAALDIVVARAAELGVTRVATVHLLLGEDDEHTEEALRFAWAEVSAGTCAQDAQLVFETVPGDGVRLAAMDVERDPTDSDKRPTVEGGAIG
jgi:Zn finger protein HypA/HybF involved in hydrogenase expression